MVKRKLFILLFSVAVFFSFTLSAAAQTRSFIIILIDNQPVRTDVVAFKQDDRVVVPLRYIAEALGCQVSFIEPNGLLLTQGNTEISLFEGKRTYFINDSVRQMDVAPFMQNYRTFVPVRFVAEALNSQVKWVQPNKVYLYRQGFEGQVVSETPTAIQETGQPLARNASLPTVSRGGYDIRYVREYDMVSTAYTYTGNNTYTGVPPRKGIVAVDPRVIPLGSRLYVDGYGFAQALDIGSKIKGNRIDVFWETRSQALNWGRRSLKVYLLP